MTYNYPNTSGVINITPSALTGLGINLNPGDILNVPSGSFDSMKGTGLAGNSANWITINFAGGVTFNLLGFTFENQIKDCSFLKITNAKLLNCTHAVFCVYVGQTHDIIWEDFSGSNLTDQHMFEIGANGGDAKPFVGTKASTYYNLKWNRCTFNNSTGGLFVILKDNSTVTLDCEFTNSTVNNNRTQPGALSFHGYGWKIYGNKFTGVGAIGHLGVIEYYGYADIYDNEFTDSWANDVRNFPLKLSVLGYSGANRCWNNISHDKRKYGMFEVNTNSSNSYETDPSGYYVNNKDNFFYYNTLVRTIADVFQANIIDFYGADGTVKGNLILQPETDKTYNSNRNYCVYYQDATYHTSTVVQAYNYQRQTVVPADFNDTTWSPVAGGSLLNNMPEDISFIIKDFYGNPRKFGSASDAGAVEYQGVPNQPPIARAGVDITITFPTNAASLSAAASSDADGTIVSYFWEKVTGPAGGNITTPNAAGTTITDMVPGGYLFRVTVTDNNGSTSSDEVNIIVNPAVALPANIIANQPRVLIGKVASSFIAAGLNSTNIKIIFLVGNPLKSWKPDRGINGISDVEVDKGYFVVGKEDTDGSAFFLPPFPASLPINELTDETGVNLLSEDGSFLLTELTV